VRQITISIRDRPGGTVEVVSDPTYHALMLRKKLGGASALSPAEHYAMVGVQAALAALDEMREASSAADAWNRTPHIIRP